MLMESKTNVEGRNRESLKVANLRSKDCLLTMKKSLPSSILRKRNLGRLFLIAASVLVVKAIFFPRRHEQEIKHHNVLERVTHADKTLDVQRHDFLQRRMGGGLRKDMFDDLIHDGG